MIFQETKITEMTLSQVAGIFYVLVGGLAIALGVALVEFCQHGRAEAARANVPLRAALTAKARMASRADRKHGAQRTPQRDHDRLPWNGGAFAGVNIKTDYIDFLFFFFTSVIYVLYIRKMSW